MTEQKENIVQLAPYLEADKDKVIELFLLANEALTQNNVEMYYSTIKWVWRKLPFRF
jgi:hypothetical protein